MTQGQTLRIGTRGSKLALIQSNLVAMALTAKTPGLAIETVVIKTKGDQNMAPIPLDTVGKAWFTAEIERALAAGDIDLAVHSLKDLPLETPPDLDVVYALKRADPRDALISPRWRTLQGLPHGAVVGTDSTRRKALLLERRPDLQVKSLRGNVQTRLAKVHDGDYDAIVLAAAGLDRLGQVDEATELFNPVEFVPAIGQGILAVQVRQDHNQLKTLLNTVSDPETAAAAATERAFSAAIGGGCKMPVGCYADIKARQMTVHGMVADLHGHGICRASLDGPVQDAARLARQLAENIISTCGFQLSRD